MGTRISYHLYKKYGEDKIEPESIKLIFKGSAGQSFGAFAIKGLKLILKGDANDYVAKGLSGATISIKLQNESNIISKDNTIIGNTVLYGATSGYLFAAGQAGERFAVRNSGATAVVEGCGSNGCEYMTGGTIVVLGDVGDNFGAGMTGGMGFVYDPENTFQNKVNPETIIWQKLETKFWKNELKKLLQKHYEETSSEVSKKIIENFDQEIIKFYQVCPKEMLDKLENPITNKKSKRCRCKWQFESRTLEYYDTRCLSKLYFYPNFTFANLYELEANAIKSQFDLIFFGFKSDFYDGQSLFATFLTDTPFNYGAYKNLEATKLFNNLLNDSIYRSRRNRGLAWFKRKEVKEDGSWR